MGLSGWVALESGIIFPEISTACGGLVPSKEDVALYATTTERQPSARTRITKNLIFMRSRLRKLISQGGVDHDGLRETLRDSHGTFSLLILQSHPRCEYSNANQCCQTFPSTRIAITFLSLRT